MYDSMIDGDNYLSCWWKQQSDIIVVDKVQVFKQAVLIPCNSFEQVQ